MGRGKRKPREWGELNPVAVTALTMTGIFLLRCLRVWKRETCNANVGLSEIGYVEL